MQRRDLLLMSGATAFPAAWAQPSSPYPNKPIRIIVSAVPGSPGDVTVRKMTAALSEILRQPLIVDNKPGGNGVIAATELMKAPHDGYTLLNASTSNALNDVARPTSGPKMNEELVPITDLSSGPILLLIHPSVPARTGRELVEYSKKNPKALSYGSGGPGSLIQFVGERLKLATGLQMLEVPYKSPGADIVDLLAGNIQVGMTIWAAVEGFVRSGKLRVLAAATDRRMKVAPDVPTFEEAGLTAITASAWTGMFAAAGTPSDVVQLLNRAIAMAVNKPDFVEFWAKDGSDVGGRSTAEFAAFVRAEKEHYRLVVAQANLKLE